jgi:hypothetical protein
VNTVKARRISHCVLQVAGCRLHRTDKQQSKRKKADKHMQETTKINEEKQNRKKTNGNVPRDHVQKRAKNQRSRFLQAYEIKISYTLEDGHVVRNM